MSGHRALHSHLLLSSLFFCGVELPAADHIRSNAITRPASGLLSSRHSLFLSVILSLGPIANPASCSSASPVRNFSPPPPVSGRIRFGAEREFFVGVATLSLHSAPD